MRISTIRRHLLLLVLVAAVPLFVAVSYGIYDDFHRAVAVTKTALRAQAATMVKHADERMGLVKAGLKKVGRDVFAHELSPPGCRAQLSAVALSRPWLRRALSTDLEGRVTCTSGDEAAPFLLPPELLTQLATRDVVFSAPRRVEGGALVPMLSAALRDDAGRLRGALQVELELLALDPALASEFLPASTRYGFFDAAGTLLWRNLDPEHVIGQRPDAEAARRIVEVKDGAFEAQAVDGVRRFFTVVPLPELEWVAFVGVPSDSVFAEPRARAARSTSFALALVVVLALVAAALARRIAEPIARLEQVARDVTGGQLDVRAALDGPREIAAVAAALNDLVSARRRAEEQMRTLLEHHAVVAWLRDAEGRLEFATTNFLRFSAVGGLEEQARRDDLELLAGRGVKEQVVERKDPEGRTSWWLSNKFVFTSFDGRQMIGGLAVDITELKATEQAKRLSDELLDQAFSASPIGMAVTAADGQLLRVNRALCTMLGRTEAELRATTFRALTHPDDRGKDSDALAATLRGERSHYQTEKRYLRNDGQPLWAHVTATLVRGTPDGPRHLLTQVQDIAERKRAETSARLAVVGTLAAGAAHEVNNPLTYVLSNLSWVSDELEALRAAWPAEHRARLEELVEALAEAQGGAQRISTIITGLKTFSRQSEQPRQPTDVAKVVRTALLLTQPQLRNQARVEEHFEPAPLVLASGGQLEQVFVNLLVNAAQAIPEGEADRHRITVSVRGEGAEVIAEVKDTGTGIAPDVMAHLFEPFFTTKPVGVGTGLGLPICHGLVTSFGGRIEVDSTPGAGSTFRVVLPALPAHVRGADATTREALHPLPKGQRVLVLDDDPMVGRGLARSLAGGPEVVVISSAREALERITGGERFDVVVCDLMMPELSGEEFQRRVAAVRPELARTMIFITGGAFTPSASSFLAATKNAWLQKPVSANSLRQLVASALSVEPAPGAG